MKKLLIFLVLITVFITNCGTILVNAPPKEDIRLLSETEPTSFKTSMRTWYVLWGLVPITNNSTADIIAKHQLKNVKVKTYYSFVDYVIAAFLGGFTIYTKTTEIEGNISK